MTETVTRFWVVFQRGGEANPQPLAAPTLAEAMAETETLQTRDLGWAAIYDVPDHQDHRPARATRSVGETGFDPWVQARDEGWS